MVEVGVENKPGEERSGQGRIDHGLDRVGHDGGAAELPAGPALDSSGSDRSPIRRWMTAGKGRPCVTTTSWLGFGSASTRVVTICHESPRTWNSPLDSDPPHVQNVLDGPLLVALSRW